MPEVDEEITEILEFNLQFLRENADDHNRYFVGPEVLTALTWAVTSIALPIMISGANEVVQSKVQAWLQRKKQYDIAKRLTEVPAGSGGDAQRTAEAINCVADYLSTRGWPQPMAQSDATQIVGIFETRLK